MKINRPTLIGLVAPLLWATSLPFIKQCSSDIGAFYLPAIQYLASGCLGFAYFVVTSRRPCEGWKRPRFPHRLILFTSYFVLLYPAIFLVQKANFPGVLLLNYLWPTFTLLFTLALVRQPVQPTRLVCGTVLVMIGMVLEIFPNQVLAAGAADSSVEVVPYVMAFGAAVSWGLYSALNRKWGDSAGGVQAIPVLMFSAGMLLLALAAWTEEFPTFSTETAAPLIYLCVMPFLANVAWDIGTRHGNLPVLSLVCDFIPWISLTLTALYLEVPLGIATILSAGLIVIGAVVSRLALVPVRTDKG